MQILLAFLMVIVFQSFVPSGAQQHPTRPTVTIGAVIKPPTPGIPARKASAAQLQRIKAWFARYDSIRRRAQMTSSERAEADRLMNRGFLVVFSSDNDKEAGRHLLNKMIARYDQALAAMQSLPRLVETESLRLAYTNYFKSARRVFQDSLAVNDNVFAEDANGKSIRRRLKKRKAALTVQESSTKALDRQTRERYRVAGFDSDV